MLKKVVSILYFGTFGVAVGMFFGLFLLPLLKGSTTAMGTGLGWLTIILFTTLSALSAIFFEYFFEFQVKKSRAKCCSLKRLSNFADFFGLGLRRRIKAVAGDFDVEIKRLHKEKRYKTAEWNKALAWGYAIWYVLRGPFDWFAETFIKSWKGL